MRKQTKLVAVLSAAALLAVGASMVVSAKGWTEENGEWYYTDANGNYVYDTWKQSGSSWFYLGSDGAMVKDALINDSNDNYYYVDSNGVRVTSKWVEVASDEYNDGEEDTNWYYFQNSGRAYKNSSNDTLFKRVIDGKTYAFDSEGKMLYGWVDENGDQIAADDTTPYATGLYYFNTEHDGSFGAMTEGWLAFDNNFDDDAYEDQDVLYFYFQSSGKKVENADDAKDAYKTKTINGLKYAFDHNGVMKSDWQLATATSATATDIQYFSDENDGHLKKNKWIYAVPSESMDAEDYNDGSESWFYVNNSGDVVKNKIQKINGKYYLFDEIGRMQDGIKVVTDGKVDGKIDTDLTANEALNAVVDKVANGSLVYYFGSDGDRKSGTYTFEFSDDTYTMVFNSNGTAKGYETAGKNTVLSSKVYNTGFLVKASVDDKYVPVTVNENGKEVVKVVNTSGSVLKNNAVVRDGNDNYLIVVNGVFAGVTDDSKVASAFKACGGDADKFDKTNLKDQDGNVITKDDIREVADNAAGFDVIAVNAVSKN